MSCVMVTERNITFCGIINDESSLELLHALSTMNCYEDEVVILTVNSQGGCVDDAIGIYDLLKALPYKTHGMVFGQASSAAVLILQGCTKRFVSENSVIMIHEGTLGADPKHPKETEIQIKAYLEMGKRAKQILCKSSGLTEKELEDRMRFATYYVGKEAVKVGFADSVVKKRLK